MSTAGKVLIVLIMLGSVVWMVSTAGVAQLNKNYSEALHKLEVQYEDMGKELEQTRADIAALNDQVSTTQEKTDIELAVLRARLAEVEKARSQIAEALARAQNQLATVEDTIKEARA